MPYVELGTTVRWHMTGERGPAPHAAIVVGIGHDSLSLLVLNPMGGYQFKDGVKHYTDPRCKLDADKDEDLGAWEHTKLTQALIELTEQKWQYQPATSSWA